MIKIGNTGHKTICSKLPLNKKPEVKLWGITSGSRDFLKGVLKRYHKQKISKREK